MSRVETIGELTDDGRHAASGRGWSELNVDLPAIVGQFNLGQLDDGELLESQRVLWIHDAPDQVLTCGK